MINDYKTIYLKDFIPKRLENIKEINEINSKKNIEFPNPVNEAFKNYLCVDPCDVQYADELHSYTEKAVKKYPGFNYTIQDKPINKDVIRKDKIFDGRTEYQVTYCDIERDIAYKKYLQDTAIVLTIDAHFPVTSQQASHRPPKSINSNAYDRVLCKGRKNNLDPNHKIREILQVKTGDSEYMRIIGRLGSLIMDQELLGVCPKQ